MGNAESGEQKQDFQTTGGHGPDIFLNVYVPTSGGQPGVYHTGIQIGSTEYAYGGGSVSSSGIYTQTPKEDPPGEQWKFSQSIPLGKAKVDAKRAVQHIEDLKPKFPANNYNVVHCNCNHFTESAAKVLGVSVNYPTWVNRLARMGKSTGIGGGDYKGTGAPEDVEETKTVFESTQGHKLDDGDKKADVYIDPRTGKPNPWAKK